MDDVTQTELDKQNALFRGIAGWARMDEDAGRLVFWPSIEGMESQAYAESLIEVGDPWSEWVFEVDMNICHENGVWVIDYP